MSEVRSIGLPETVDPADSVALRPARGVRLVEQGGVVVAYPEPHRTPVLPVGWAPLSREQQDAVLRACDGSPDTVTFRLGSLWEPGCEYRVYRLSREQWGGIQIVTKFAADADAAPWAERSGNRQLLGLAWDACRAIGIAVDFFNWDLEAHGQAWRLGLTSVRPEDR